MEKWTRVMFRVHNQCGPTAIGLNYLFAILALTEASYCPFDTTAGEPL